MKPERVTKDKRGSPWLKDLYNYFAPARREIQERGYTEDEIDSAIDEAVAAVRREHSRRLPRTPE